MSLRAVGLALVPFVTCCSQGTTTRIPLGPVTPLETPADAGAETPNLALTADGVFLLSWVAPQGDGVYALRFSSRAPGGEWSSPRTIASGDDWFVNWADFPSLAALEDGTLYAHWLSKSGAGTYAYDVRISISHDGGETWSTPITPHTDGSISEHGFVSMTPLSSNQMGISWLDGRNTVTAGGQPKAHGDPGAEMALMFATLDSDGAVQSSTALDTRVCDCCQTSATMGSSGPIVVYRDRSPEEVRDIAVTRAHAGAWTSPVILGDDRWLIAGCPVNGPAIDARGADIVVAWFSAPAEQARVQVAFSGDSGATWDSAFRVDDGHAIGRVDVEWLPDASALVSWIQHGQSGTRIVARRVARRAESGEIVAIAATDAARASGFPRMIASETEILFAWRDGEDPSHVRTALRRIGGP